MTITRRGIGISTVGVLAALLVVEVLGVANEAPITWLLVSSPELVRYAVLAFLSAFIGHAYWPARARCPNCGCHPLRPEPMAFLMVLRRYEEAIRAGASPLVASSVARERRDLLPEDVAAALKAPEPWRVAALLLLLAVPVSAEPLVMPDEYKRPALLLEVWGDATVAPFAVTSDAACLTPSGTVVRCDEPTALLCWDDPHRIFAPCAHVAKHDDSRPLRVTLVTVGKGFDIYTTAVAIDAGAREGNPVQPTVEHRVGMSMLEIGGVLGIEEVAAGNLGWPSLREWMRERVGPKWARRIAWGFFATRVGVGAWNLGQAAKARNR